MHKPRIYIDTSVIGGCFDEEFAEWSNKLFEELKDGKKIAVISDLTIEEIEEAYKYIQDKLWEIPSDSLEILRKTKEIEELSDKYIEYNAISSKHTSDATHIAYATINRVNVLVSWNFKHIVNLRRITLYNSINMQFNYPLLEIRTPREVLENEEEL
jgi:hypothetical protein